jgi:hypothetical protein
VKLESFLDQDGDLCAQAVLDAKGARMPMQTATEPWLRVVTGLERNEDDGSSADF